MNIYNQKKKLSWNSVNNVMNDYLTYAESVNSALIKILENKKKSVCMGLGINDPKRIFNTTANLKEKFGEARIIEPPTSENALTGICFGMTLNGYSVCLTHQRFDFSLLSFDQLINTLSKWKFMLGLKENKTSILVRLIVGRGWGQGPTHSQSYHSFLSSLPGINVLYPFDPDTAYHSILKGMNSGIPSIMIEHRWLHNTKGKISKSEKNIDEIVNLRKGDDFTVFVYGYMVPEAIKASEILNKLFITIDIFTMVNLSNKDFEKVFKSIEKTKNLILIECFSEDCALINNISTEILKRREITSNLESFKTFALPNDHENTSFYKTKSRYVSYKQITNYVLKTLGKKEILFKDNDLHDIPGDWFKGPF
nr:transketolase C-terminal domain-containing protein [Prochlorococcus sp. AH-736-M13]